MLKEITIEYSCGYEKGILHFNNIKKDDKILIIDDLILTGGTIIAMIESVRKAGAEITDIGAIFDKKDYQGIEELEKNGVSTKNFIWR